MSIPETRRDLLGLLLDQLQAPWRGGGRGHRRPSVAIAGWAENGRTPDCPSSQAQTGTRKRGPGGRFVSSDAALCWQDVLGGYDVLYGTDRRFQVVRYGPHKSTASLTFGTRDDKGTCVGLYPDGALSSGGQHEGLCVRFS